MEKYIIMSDLDGTLLNNKSKISLRSKLYIRKLEKQGHYFIISTGRPFQGCINYYKELKLNSPLVCDNGGSIHFPNDHSKDIFTSIPLNLFLELIEEINPYIHAAMSSNFDTIYYYNRKDVPMFIQHLKLPRKIIEGNFLDIIKIPPINPSFYIKKDKINEVLNILNKNKYSSIINIRYWKGYENMDTVELFHKNATKGCALDKLKDLLNIKSTNDLVFGDQLNDMEMIQHASNGVAMINGREELKSIAKYISDKPNYKNGVIKFIKKFLKNKKAP